MKKVFVYLIACSSDENIYLKIGKTINMYRRLSNIQTGCPHKITHSFVIESDFEEEVDGIEKLLHRLLPCRMHGEWYKGTQKFFNKLDSLLNKINGGNFTFEEIDELPDMNAGPELEIMLHHHDFKFKHVQLPIKNGVDISANVKTILPEKIVTLLRNESASAIIK